MVGAVEEMPITIPADTPYPRPRSVPKGGIISHGLDADAA
jgi:hypothetical protein